MKLVQAVLGGLLLGFSCMSNATLILQGGTGSTGAGNIYLDAGSVIDVSHSAYFNGSTTPASDWVWASNVSENADLIFTFSFSLDGFDASTAVLSGLWGVDNVGSVSLNGVLLSNLPSVVTGNFNTLTSIFAGPNSSAFVAGLNVLTFNVGNRGGPGAFRASVEVNADAKPVSAPATLSLLAMGLALVSARRVRLNHRNR